MGSGSADVARQRELQELANGLQYLLCARGQMRFGSFLILLLAGAGAAMASDFATLSGEELIRLLQEPAWRMQAYHELDLRADSIIDLDPEAAFEGSHRNPDVVVCPQSDGSPLYVVLSDAYSHFHDNSDEPPKEPMPRAATEIPPRRDLLIEVFSPDGSRINPLPCSDNVLHGLLTDMNGDGWVERAQSIHFGIKGVKNAAVLKVERVANPVQGLLAVLYIWGDHEDWGFTFSDRNQDGLIEIDFGPLTLDGIKPKVTFHWDRYSQSYVQESFSDHLLVLTPSVDCCSAGGLTSALPEFPVDPDAAGDTDLYFLQDGELPPSSHQRTTPVSAQYQPRSFEDAANEEIYSYMGRGKDSFDFERQETPRTSIPADFWTAEPDEAALHLADVNRSTTHRAKYQLVSVKTDSEPARAGLSLVEGGAHWDMDYSYFLKAGKQGSYVSLAAIGGSRQRDDDPSYEPPRYNIQICELPNSTAQQAMAVLWRLHQIRTDPAGKTDDRHGFTSTGDGTGTTQWFLPGKKEALFSATGDVGISVAEQWDSSFEEEEYVGIISEFFESALPQVAKPCWKEGPKQPQELRPAVRKLLELFASDQSSVTYVTADYAVHAAGVLGFTELRPRIESILKLLPLQPVQLRCKDDVWKELDAEEANLLTPSGGDYKDLISKTQSRLARSEDLMQEWDALESGANADCNIRDLRESISITLRQLSYRDDAAALQTWIDARDQGWRWALWRLQQLGAPRAASILESFLKTAPDDQAAADILEQIGKLQPQRARALAKDRLDPQHPHIYLDAFLQLDKADQDTRLNELLQLMIAEQTDYSARHDILEKVVPTGDPLRFPNRDVDRALRTILHSQLSDQWDDLRGESAHALVLRNGAAAADDVMQGLEESSDFSTQEILRDAEDLYPDMDPKQRERLQQFLQNSLDQHLGAINDLASIAWVLDLRAFKPQLEALANSGPEDFEGDNCSQWGEDDMKSIRCHQTRRVAALWNERNPLTRFKMLFSWYSAEPYDFDWLDPSVYKLRWRMLENRLMSDLDLMTPAQAKDAFAFMDWRMAAHPFNKYELDYGPRLRQLISDLRRHNIINREPLR